MTGREGNRRKGFFEDLSIEAMFEINPLELGSGCSYVPYTDIVETDACFVVEMELPGVKKEDVHLDVTERYITVQGTKQKEERDRGDTKRLRFHCMGRVFGKFKRTFEVPSPFNMHGVKAGLEKGLLVITVPKLDEKRQKKIKVAIE